MSENDYPYENWMGHLPEELTHLPINYIALPGTHNSGTYCISSNSALSPDANETFETIESIFGVLARSIIAKWAKSQQHSIYEQLKSGIRYFDLRISINSQDKNQFYIVHSMFAGILDREFKEIDTFLKSHPKEIVLLDFNHFYAMGDSEHKALIAMIKNTFGSRLAPFQSQPSSLSALHGKQQQVFVFYHNNLGTSQLARFWPGYYIPSPWANTPDVDTLIEFLDAQYQTSHRPNWFLVCQGVLTPTTDTILKNAFAGIKQALANKATPAFVEWLEDKTSGTSNGINACIVDFAEDFDFVSNVIQINLKRLNANDEFCRNQ